MTTFAAYLKTQRQQHGLSLQRVATLVGCSRQYVAHMENGLAKPSDAMCEKLAAALGQHPDVVYTQARHLPPDIRAYAKAHLVEFCESVRSIKPVLLQIR